MNSSTDISRSTRRTERRRQPAYKVGLTGGIASGKSTVAGLFSLLGVAVIDTDQIARDVVQPGSSVLAAIVARFGPQVLQADGSLDRRQLRTLVFADDRARADLEALTHPAIADETELRSKAATGPYLLIAVPLLAVITLLISKKAIMGPHTGNRWLVATGWLTTAIMGAAALCMALFR